VAIYKFENIAFNSTEKKKPVEEDKYTYLGLEHLDPDSIYVTRYGSEIAPKGEKLLMKNGDVLFGKRRAYQKKVAIAPFDGIFSAHGMVLRPKEDVIDKDFFPLFIKSDYFLDEAIKISVGSLSPTINWRDLKELKFALPSLPEQKKLATALWSIYETKENYKKLIKATDDLVKSQFIEMFGQLPEQFKHETVKLGDIAEMISGGTPSSKHPEYYGNKYPFVTTPCLGKNYIDESDAQNWLSEMGVNNSSTHIIPAFSVMYGSRVGVGKSSINMCEMCTNQDILSFFNIDKTKYDLLFIKKVMDQYFEYIDTQKRGSTIKGVPSDLVKAIRIPLVPIEEQRQFTEFAEQSDKSKFALQDAIENLDALSKKIIAENLITAGKE
jgi:type I restriction enzyme S subunit